MIVYPFLSHSLILCFQTKYKLEESLDFDKYWVFCDLINGSIAFEGNKAEIFITLFFTPLFERFSF
jgi:hypothetical protein